MDIWDLANCESAGFFDTYISGYLWDVAGRMWLERATFLDAIGQFTDRGLSGKNLIREISLSSRRVFIPSKLVEPWISKTSSCSVKATPHPHADEFENSAVSHYVFPERAFIPIAIGTCRGLGFVIGVKVSAAGPVNDGLSVGIAAIGCAPCTRSVRVMFAPFSGRCFLEAGNGAFTRRTQALQSVPDVREVYIWIQVTEDYGIRFFRQFKGSQLEDTGLLPPRMFPCWIQSYFAFIDLWGCDLESEVNVSVEHSGSAFPASMLNSSKPGAEIRTAWVPLDEDYL